MNSQMMYPYNPYANPYAMQPPVQQQPSGSITHPMVNVDVALVADLADAEQLPVAAGSSQIMITKDDQHIFVKTGTTDGYKLDVYERKASKSSTPDLSQYVTRDELAELIRELKGGEKNEPV